MASPNRQHWPSMFRSKHASQLWQPPQPDMTSSPPPSLKYPFSSSGHEESRSTDPKPRWSPRPEQIRILEAIFNSGMVNPPRDEIPRIRMQLQEYGQVGDANVFYWFQNRKSRSKNKLRNAAAGRAAAASAPPARACAPPAGQQQQQQAAALFTTPPPAPAPAPAPPSRQVTLTQVQPQQQLFVSPSPVAPTSSSSSSSDRSSGTSKPVRPAVQHAMCATAAMDLLSPLAAACHQQMHYQLGHQPVVPSAVPAPAPPTVEEFVAAAGDEPIFPQWPQGHCLSVGELAAILGAQYVPVSAQQPPAALPAGMFLGLCNDVAAGPTSTAHRNSAWPGAGGLGHCWPCGGDQLGLAKNGAAFNASVAREDQAHKDATKLGLLQYGLGVSSPAAAASAASAADVLPLPASSEHAVTVATVAATAGLTSTFATAVSAITFDHLQGPAPDAGFAGAAAAAAATGMGGTKAVARGAAAVVCIAGTSATCTVPATRLDVKAYFGEGAVLVRCTGDRAEPLPVDEAGLTVEPLQHGALYFCVLI